MPWRRSRLTAGIISPQSPTQDTLATKSGPEAGVTAEQAASITTHRSILRTPRIHSIDTAGFQAAMRCLGRLLTAKEAEALVYYFDQNGNSTVDFEEFRQGVARLVGSGCPHGSGYLSFHSHFACKFLSLPD